MEYLKIVKSGTISSASEASAKTDFDTHGYKARLLVAEGTLYICGEGDGAYPVEKGSFIEFVGRVKYYGTFDVQYILFDKI